MSAPSQSEDRHAKGDCGQDNCQHHAQAPGPLRPQPVPCRQRLDRLLGFEQRDALLLLLQFDCINLVTLLVAYKAIHYKLGGNKIGVESQDVMWSTNAPNAKKNKILTTRCGHIIQP